MLQKIIHFFDKLEDIIRAHLSRFPIIYTIIGAIAIVLFWRGVWNTADILYARGGIWGILLYEPTSLIVVTLVLLATGLFVSYFIGDAILLSGAKSQKKLAEKTGKEIEAEEANLTEIKDVMEEIRAEVKELKHEVEEEHKLHGHVETEKEVTLEKK